MQIVNVIGIDEVGRGALCGPVYMAGTKLSSDYPLFTQKQSTEQFTKKYKNLDFVRDSKLLQPKLREKACQLISTHQIPNLTLQANNFLIDKYGIGVCLSLMMKIIIFWLLDKNIQIFVDGKIKIRNQFNPDLLKEICKENNLNIPLKEFNKLIISEKSEKSLFEDSINIVRENKADDKYLSIALASNIAKVQRDRLMQRLDKEFPEYNWSTNKGYGTQMHRKKIKKNPYNKYLRQTFFKQNHQTKN
ncbi:ribonuclease HII [Candidatus Gracilibacteria bacterium]|nr:ribonuclease HII [Candidatus Gracilibacteria bacterium]